MSFIISRNLLKFMSIDSVMPSDQLILCHPFLLLTSILSSIRVFSNELALHIRWAKYWSFTFSISPSSEYSGLISFRIDCFDLLAVQETLKSLLQHPRRSSRPKEVCPALAGGFFTTEPPGKSLILLLLLLLLSRFSRVRLCATPQTAAHKAPSLGFSRQEHWSGLPFPSPMHESEKCK